MSERLNELESALRQLQPAPVAQGHMLIEMGRASTIGSARRWRWVSLLSSMMTVALAGILVLRPEPPTMIRVVYSPAIAPSETRGRADERQDPQDEPIEPIGPTFSHWRLRQYQVHRMLEPIANDEDDEPDVEPRSVRAGDLLKDPTLWLTFTNSGVR